MPDDLTRSQTPPAAAGPAPATPPAPGGVTAGGWTQAPLLRDDPSDHSPIVRVSPASLPEGEPGRYQLLGEIARGGMGIVLKGRDPELGRDLAVKVLRPEHAGRPAAEQRFVEEAQVGGQLQHPGIVPVYDLGRFPDGRPFFTMKLVKGRTLAALLDGRPHPAHDLGPFLKVFEQVCQTLAYAHSKGVIHRDVKPANVMVGAFGEVQVMDWGLAKVLPLGGAADEERARANGGRPVAPPREEATVIRTVRSGGSSDGTDTEAGSMLGTPAFMPPEQAGGELDKLDERADVFGLGAVLCVILTGRPPYVGPTGEAVRLLAVRGKLAECFSRLDACGADAPLIELCKRCLAAEPADRPRDAGRVAEAVAEYQASVTDRLRRAEVEGAEERVRLVEERRRRKTTTALAAAILAIVVAGGGMGFWLVEQRQSQATRTDLALQNVEVLQEQAAGDPDNPVGRWRDAGAALTRAEGILGENPAARAKARLEAVREAVAAGLREAEGNRNLLDQLDRIRTEKEGEAADAAFAAAFRAAGLDADALTPDEWKTRLAAKPAAVRAAALPTLDVWAMFRRDAGNEPGVRHLFAVAGSADPDPWRNRLRAALQARDLVALHRLAEDDAQTGGQGPVYLWLLGLGHALNGDNKGAADVLRPAQRKFSGDYALNMELSNAIQDMQRGGAATSVGLSTSTNRAVYQQAEPFARAAVALRPELARARLHLAVILDLQDRFPEAEPEYLAAIRLDPADANVVANYAGGLRRAGREKDSQAQYARALAVNPADAWAQAAVEAVLKKEGRVDEVIALYERGTTHAPAAAAPKAALALALVRHGRGPAAVEYLEKAIAADPKNVTLRGGLARVYDALGTPHRAVDVYRAAVAADPSAEAFHTLLALALDRRGAAGDRDEAVRQFEESAGLDPTNYHVRTHYALVLLKQGRAEDALRAVHTALELRPRHLPAHAALLDVLAGCGRLDEAVKGYQKQADADPKDPFHHHRLGVALERQGKTAEAARAYGRALELHPRFAEAFAAQYAALQKLRRYDDWVALCQGAVARDPRSASPHNNLGVALQTAGRADEAVAAYRQAIALDPALTHPRTNLTLLLADRGRFPEAVAAAREAVASDPKRALYAYYHGLALRRRGDSGAAVEAFRAALELDPGLGAAHDGLIAASATPAQLAAAAAFYEKAVADHPADPVHHVRLGLVLEKRKQTDAALAAFRKALDVSPKSAVAQAALSRAFEKLKRYDAAVEVRRAGLALDPANATLHNSLGVTLATSGRVAEAAAAYERAVELDPKLAYPRTNLCLLWSQEGDFDKALRTATAAAESDPHSALYAYHRGVVLQRRGDWSGAVAEFRRAVRLEPANSGYAAAAAYPLIEQGKLDEGVAEFQRAVARDPQNAPLRNSLGIFLARQGKFAEAIQEYEACVALDPKTLFCPSNIERANRMLAVRDRLPAFQKGEFRPATAAELAGLVGLLHNRGEDRAAARLCVEAFAAHPEWAEDKAAFNLYYAAASAVLAAKGGATDKPDAEEARGWRKQALEWLRTAADQRRKQLGSEKPEDRADARRALNFWKNSYLVSVREKSDLLRLPADERKQWEAFWEEVDGLTEKANEAAP